MTSLNRSVPFGYGLTKACTDFRVRSMDVVAERTHLDLVVSQHADAGTHGFGLRPEAAALHKIG